MVRISDLVKAKGPLTDRQLQQVEKWLEEDWESTDVDREIVTLISRLVKTVKARRE